ncbi:MAG TPA: ADP-forming succinate--CoA ligase subunit beta [candidate division Zixibacteria bacterium]|nr:ADP-forming succinate--CoA ligase subunit beta [candidate division Zixibacteria bacterium]MDD4918209.1 ADP-forming succinate--CoA ligase subunit beta [candidate division Zixibacteria bacterium]MDM7973713.1 ADP-forming succinate--CoA ligase subunit beta [candidate division Zixibacteria bacterium]HOD66432.1 ADP-forming succinate--CoA ligase subunit beta [candidate division Zixibacteria bacterium]HOZ07943.1 ADP-forming succinate--CoA ligase subunit beta [candidate division Zixibacteria bacteriu
MKIHEYQAKQLFARHGIPVPAGDVATTPLEAYQIADRVNKPVMVKAQVHVGGRGKAGGVKYAENAEAAKVLATTILGMDIKGLTVKKVLVTEAADIISEAYVGIILDRASRRPVIMVSAAGGIDIEEVAAKTPEKIHKLAVDPVTGLKLFQARNLAYKLYRDISQVRQAADIIMKLYETFWAVDASLVEINPLITNAASEVVAIDAKVNIDDNALYRQPAITAMRDLDAEPPTETQAREADLSYVKLEGTIGCMVNGAGLAMATMDLVKRYGGEPANFLDIGGSSNPQKVVTALRIITSDPNVKAILVNIFGGITRCDDVANGLVQALDELKPKTPIVVRLAGTNEAEAARILARYHLPFEDTLDKVVKKAIALAGGQD